jgi:hypothetical protein
MKSQETIGQIWMNSRPDGIASLQGYVLVDDQKHNIQLIPNPSYRHENGNCFYRILRQPWKPMK